MSSEPVVVHQDGRTWERWPSEQVAQRGDVAWKTLISAGLTRSDSLTLGIAKLAPGKRLHAHRHEQAEAYLVLAGSAVHSVESTGQTDLRVAYVFAADAFEDVEYVFGE